jgi:hypothetical protein
MELRNYTDPLDNTKTFIDQQIGSRCQLISAINARVFWGGDKIEPDSEEFERLTDVAGCRLGAALPDGMRAVHDSLDLYEIEGEPTFEWVRNHLPVEMSVWHVEYGYHSILIVGVKGDRIYFTNYFDGSMYWHNFEDHIAKFRCTPRCKQLVWTPATAAAKDRGWMCWELPPQGYFCEKAIQIKAAG